MEDKDGDSAKSGGGKGGGKGGSGGGKGAMARVAEVGASPAEVAAMARVVEVAATNPSRLYYPCAPFGVEFRCV